MSYARLDSIQTAKPKGSFVGVVCVRVDAATP